MRVAILLTGFLRTYKETYSLLESSILNKYFCDIYSITWSKQEGNNSVDEKYFELYKKNLKKYKIIDSEEYYKNKKVFEPLDRDNDVFKTNIRAKEHGTYWANRLIDQWKLVHECFNLIENPNEYDLILRLRYDLKLYNITLNQTDNLVIPKDGGGWEFTDHMAYGNPKIMKIYCDLYNNIENLYVEDNIDITHAVDLPKFYTIKNNINFLVDNNINYSIFK
jgi:hypothetical protein